MILFRFHSVWQSLGECLELTSHCRIVGLALRTTVFFLMSFFIYLIQFPLPFYFTGDSFKERERERGSDKEKLIQQQTRPDDKIRDYVVND